MKMKNESKMFSVKYGAHMENGYGIKSKINDRQTVTAASVLLFFFLLGFLQLTVPCLTFGNYCSIHSAIVDSLITQ